MLVQKAFLAMGVAVVAVGATAIAVAKIAKDKVEENEELKSAGKALVKDTKEFGKAMADVAKDSITATKAKLKEAIDSDSLYDDVEYVADDVEVEITGDSIKASTDSSINVEPDEDGIEDTDDIEEDDIEEFEDTDDIEEDGIEEFEDTDELFEDTDDDLFGESKDKAVEE